MSDPKPSATPPDRDPRALTSMERARNYLAWGIGGSLLIHLIGGPFLGKFKFTEAEPEKTHKVEITRAVVTPKPTPVPTPTPPPTPVPKATPPPKETPPPQHIKLSPPKQTSKTTTQSSETKVVAQKGVEDTGKGNIANGTGTSTAAPAATAAPPTPTPKPACANPNADATTTRAAQPDYPEIARQQGWSGVSQIEVSLSATGAVTGVKVYKSSGYGPLDQAAMQAAKASAFAPAIKDCEKVAGDYVFRAEFAPQ